jgi:SAM-dependent methyltransferase
MAFDPEAVRVFEHARWQRAAAAYPQSFAPATQPFIAALLDAACVGAGMPVLDLACGPGHVAAGAADRGAIATGLDFSAAMLDVARAARPDLAFRQGDAEAMPFADASFGAVVSNFGVHHVPRPALALREAYRVLRPGGRFAFTVWADPAENVAWRLLFDAVRRFGDPGAAAAPPPGGGFGVAQCVEALRQAGFERAETRLERRRWRHPDAASLVASLRAGTARMAAMIEAQPATAMAGILQDIEENAAPFRDGAELAMPIAAVVAWGCR